MWKRIALVSALGLITLVGFNNCGEGFQSSGVEGLQFSSEQIGPGTRTILSREDQIRNTKPQAGGNFSSPYRILTGAEVANSLSSILSTSFDDIIIQGYFPEATNTLFSNFQDNIHISMAHTVALKKIGELVDEKLRSNNFNILLSKFNCLKIAETELCRKTIIDHYSILFLRRKISTELFFTYDQFLSDDQFGETLVERVVLFLSALSQSSSFIIRNEVGDLSGNSFVLNQFEIASRISFLITGAGPDLLLLNAAASGELKNENIRRSHAERLLSSELGKKRIIEFNKQLFNIQSINVSPEQLKQDFIKETELFIEDTVLTKNEAWKNLFTKNKSFMNRSLAAHYGEAAVSGDEFILVPYTSGKRSGILSHGSFLSAGYGGDSESTNTVRRGLQIANDLLCMDIPSHANSNIGLDNQQAPGVSCKIEGIKSFNLSKSNSCHTCHSIIDGAGLGLERFNLLGQYRTTYKNNSECSAVEQGTILDQPFENMIDLGRIISSSQSLDLCLVRRVAEFSFGNKLNLGQSLSFSEELLNYNQNKNLKSLIVDLVSSSQFLRRDK